MSKYVIEVLGVEKDVAKEILLSMLKEPCRVVCGDVEHAAKCCDETVKTSGVNEMPTGLCGTDPIGCCAAESAACASYTDGYKQCELMVIKALGGHPSSKLWGPEGLLAATMKIVDGYSKQEEQLCSVMHDREHLRCISNELRECNVRLVKERDVLSKCWKEAVKLNGTLIADHNAKRDDYKATIAALESRLGAVESMKDQIEGLGMLLHHWDKVQSHIHDNCEDEVIGTYIPAIVLRRLEERNRLKNLVMVLQGKLDAIKEVLP